MLDAAYTVLTLNIDALKQEDTGEYTCFANNATHNATKSIAIKVLPAEQVCGFESESLCGWTHLYTENKTAGHARLYYHNGDDTLTMAHSKLRSDHTYGPSKHTGTYKGYSI